MMNGVYFNELHSYNDFNLIMAPFTPAPAMPKTSYMDIAGGNGSLDFTEAFGEVKFNDRDLKFTFTIDPAETMTFDEKVTQISNALNGKKCKITLDRDADYYWDGRLTVNEYLQNKSIGQIVISATVRPYKLKQQETLAAATLCGKNLFNAADPVVNSRSLATHELIENGIRVKVTSKGSGNYRAFVRFLVAPIEVAEGKTVAIRFNKQESGSNVGAVYFGYTTAAGDAYSTEALFRNNTQGTITAKRRANCTYLALWLYADYDSTNELVVGEYVDYTNIQVEISDKVTDYEPYQATAQQTLTLKNSRKSVVPTITCLKDGTVITTTEGSYTLNAGTFKLLDLQLTEGEKTVTVEGTGAVGFRYQEGVL